jgi:hypothetical protein
MLSNSIMAIFPEIFATMLRLAEDILHLTGQLY